MVLFISKFRESGCMKKIAVAVGHTASGVAGCGAVGLLNESDETRKIAPILVEILNKNGYEAKLLRIDKANSYNYEDCYVRAEQANSWGADLYVEIHLNCSDSTSANGTEVIINTGSTVSRSYAKKVNESICKELGTFDRTYGTGYKESGLIVLRKTNMPAILIEPLFVENTNDVSKYTADKVALAIAKGIDNNIITTNNKEVKEEMNYSMYLFSKNWYLKRYTDIASNATYKENPYKHYADYGKKEGRLALPPIPEEYCEGDYLDLNPDIAAAVKKGTFVSGIDHYLQNGFCENRKICKDDSVEAIKKRVEELELKLEEVKKIVV